MQKLQQPLQNTQSVINQNENPIYDRRTSVFTIFLYIFLYYVLNECYVILKYCKTKFSKNVIISKPETNGARTHLMFVSFSLVSSGNTIVCWLTEDILLHSFLRQQHFLLTGNQLQHTPSHWWRHSFRFAYDWLVCT